MSLLGWPFDHANEDYVAGIGFWLGIAGFLLTILGFGFTLYQVSKTRSAADAAKREANRIQESLNRYEIINEATRAATSLATARNYLRNSLWVHVVDSYENVRLGLEALKSDAADLTDDQKTKIEEASTHIHNLCLRIERGLQNGHVRIDVAKTISVMGEQGMLISDIRRVIEKGLLK